MTRLEWARLAAPRPWQNRCMSTTQAALIPRSSGSAPVWPHLKRRSTPAVAPDQHRSRGIANPDRSARRGARRRDTQRSEVDWSALAADARSLRGEATTEKSRTTAEVPRNTARPGPPGLGKDKRMLLIRGASQNLLASDFYRLAPKSLSSWGETITKVQQQRHPVTFDPIGCYQLTFTTPVAASAYLDNLHRLQRLARHKFFSSGNVFWTTTAPEHYVPGETDPADLDASLDSLTVASPSQSDLSVFRRRLSLRYPWARRLSALVEGAGYGPRPPVLLVDVSPGGLDVEGMAYFIRQDGLRRDLQWKVSRPIPVSMSRTPVQESSGEPEGAKYEGEEKKEKKKNSQEQTSEEADDDDDVGVNLVGEGDRAGSRFVIPCETDWEARRFHRHWNGRRISQTDDGLFTYNYLVKTTVVSW